MKNRLTILFLLFCMFPVFHSCNRSIKSLESYISYLSDEENGMVRRRSISGVLYEVKYLPIDYLVMKETNFNPSLITDSIYNLYRNTLSFMFSIGPDENEHFDITRLDVANYDEYSKRIEELSFNMISYIHLETEKGRINPSISMLENGNSIERKKNIVVSFEVDDNQYDLFCKINDFKFVYSDDLFHTGVSKFAFKRVDAQRLPKLELL